MHCISLNASAQGTPLSNTVPNNCNNTEYFKLLRFGVDSLYLSYPGELSAEVDDELKELKQIAQSPEPHQQVKAQYPVDDHVFEVKDKGKGFFLYRLQDNAYHIQLSCSRSLPFAYVQLSSEYLTYRRPQEAEKALRRVLDQLGTVHESANVSRIDLFVDFVSSENMCQSASKIYQVSTSKSFQLGNCAIQLSTAFLRCLNR